MKIISARKWLESGTLINKYLTDYGKNNIKYYGWINPSFVDTDFMNNLKKNDCSIILNNQSILNIYFTDSEIIKYFVTHQDFKISQSEEKYDRLINEINYNQYINKEKINIEYISDFLNRKDFVNKMHSNRVQDTNNYLKFVNFGTK